MYHPSQVWSWYFCSRCSTLLLEYWGSNQPRWTLIAPSILSYDPWSLGLLHNWPFTSRSRTRGFCVPSRNELQSWGDHSRLLTGHDIWSQWPVRRADPLHSCELGVFDHISTFWSSSISRIFGSWWPSHEGLIHLAKAVSSYEPVHFALVV